MKPYNENRLEYFFSVVDFVNDEELLDYDIGVRGCRYDNEVPEEPFHNYSVSILSLSIVDNNLKIDNQKKREEFFLCVMIFVNNIIL